MDSAYLLFLALGFSASIISAVFGFGTALFVLSLGAYLLPIKEVIALSTILFLASNITKTCLFARTIDWRVALIVALASFPFAYLGAMLLAHTPAHLIKKALGIMVLLYLGLTYFDKIPKFRIGNLALVSGSAAYGFLSGLLGSGNLVKVILFRELRITGEAFVGVMAATTILTNSAKLTAYTQSGLLDSNSVWLGSGLIASAIASALMGRFLLRSLTLSQFDTGIRVILAISAVGLLIQ